MKSFKDFISEAKPIKKGDIVKIKKEFQDPGDEQYIWVAVDDEEKGRVTITPINIDLKIKPTSVVLRTMLEAEVSGDAGGEGVKIASGENSGNVVMSPSKKKKAMQDAGITPAEVGLPKDNV